MTDTSSIDSPSSPLAVGSLWKQLALLGAWALLMGLAFPQPGWWWCAHVALAPAVMAAIGSTSVWRFVWTTYASAWVWWLVRINWLAGVTGGGYVALAGGLALYFLVAFGLVRWLYLKYRGLPMTLILPLVWVSMEFVRGTAPAGGFAWFTLGHCHAPYAQGQGLSRLIQVADLFGEYGVSFLVAMTSGMVVDVIVEVYTEYQQTDRIRTHAARLSLYLWLTVTVGAWLYGQYRIGQTGDIVPDSFAMAVVQTNIPQDNKDHPTPRQQEKDWQRLLDLTRQAASDPQVPSLIVWPETVVPAPLNPQVIAYYQTAAAHDLKAIDGLRYHRQIAETARRFNVDLIVGASAYEWQPNPGRYNAAYLYLSNGIQSIERYDKIHRVPFGEYIPWVEDWPWLKEIFIRYLSPYESDYTLQPGQTRSVFRLRSRMSLLEDSTATRPRAIGSRSYRQPGVLSPSEIRVATPICFEDAVARVCRSMVYGRDATKRVDLLVNLTNDGWYSGQQMRPQHLQIAVFRCVENRVPMARSVNTGISGFIDSLGRVGPTVGVDDRHQHVEGFAVHSLAIDTRRSVWGRIGHWPVIGLVIITAGLTIGGLFRHQEPAVSPLRMNGM